MSESLLHNCRIDRMLPREAELVSTRTVLPALCFTHSSVQRSNGLDAAYKVIPFEILRLSFIFENI